MIHVTGAVGFDAYLGRNRERYYLENRLPGRPRGVRPRIDVERARRPRLGVRTRRFVR